jgi:hypothetical protein
MNYKFDKLEEAHNFCRQVIDLSVKRVKILHELDVINQNFLDKILDEGAIQVPEILTPEFLTQTRKKLDTRQREFDDKAGEVYSTAKQLAALDSSSSISFSFSLFVELTNLVSGMLACMHDLFLKRKSIIIHLIRNIEIQKPSYFAPGYFDAYTECEAAKIEQIKKIEADFAKFQINAALFIYTFSDPDRADTNAVFH